jgi:hypothetical protein
VQLLGRAAPEEKLDEKGRFALKAARERAQTCLEDMKRRRREEMQQGGATQEPPMRERRRQQQEQGQYGDGGT